MLSYPSLNQLLKFPVYIVKVVNARVVYKLVNAAKRVFHVFEFGVPDAPIDLANIQSYVQDLVTTTMEVA